MNLTPQPYQNFVELADCLIADAAISGGGTRARSNGRAFSDVGFYLVGGALGVPSLKLNGRAQGLNYDGAKLALARWLNALPVNVEWVGSWLDNSDNTFYFDAVDAFDNIEEAADAAEQRKQIAVALTKTDGVEVIDTPDLRKQARRQK